MEIKLPKDKTGLRIKHLPVLCDERLSADVPTMSLKIDVLHKFTELPKPSIHRINGEDLSKLFAHLMTIIASIDRDAMPPKSITLEGQEFVLVDFEKVGSGWHADVEESNFDIDPVRLACICYIPKGTFYGEVDQNQNLIYPIASRWQLFHDHFPLETFIQLNAFFFAQIQSINERVYKKSPQDDKKTKKKGRYDWPMVFDILSKEIGCSWYDVQQMNIFALNYRWEFMLHKQKLQAAQSKKRVRRS
jgi:hypothetical protein